MSGKLLRQARDIPHEQPAFEVKPSNRHLTAPQNFTSATATRSTTRAQFDEAVAHKQELLEVKQTLWPFQHVCIC